MANNSCIGFCMKNPKLFQELKKIGINFSNDGRECNLSTGEAYEFYFEDGDNTLYLGFNHDYMINIYLEYFLGCGNSKVNPPPLRSKLLEVGASPSLGRGLP